MFLGTYLVTYLGGPPIANQFVGVALFAPMLLGSYVASRTDIEPRRLVLVGQLVLLPISVLMVALVGSKAVTTWMVYPFELAYGFGGMVNMTSQRELLFQIAGPSRSTRVLNIELTGLASAMMAGPLIGGTSVAVFGLGVAFAVPAVLLICSTILFWYSTRRLPLAHNPAPIAAAAGGGGRVDWRLLRRSRALAVILLVTVVCNLCYFAFMPLVPVIAQRLDAGAAMAGVIGATAGVVQLVIAALLIVRPPPRPMSAYALGVSLCLGCLALLAYTPTVALALLTLSVAGIGQALFSSTQATLPVDVVAPHERAAALGLLTTTIGVALPTGMVVLGVMSGLLGAQLAMLVSALAGLAALAAIVAANRKLLMRLPSRTVTLCGPISVGREGNPITPQPELS